MRKVLLLLLIGTIGVLAMAVTEKPKIDQSIPPKLETATFGLGCFWGSEASFGGIEGVYRTSVGYAGGTKPDPTYYSLGDHTETVQVQYDNTKISYKELLEIFWDSHNPYGKSFKRQYMSLILYHSDEQKNTAQEFIAKKEKESGRKSQTELAPYEKFYRAEDYHLKFNLQRNGVVLEDLLRYYDDIFALDDSTAAARLNALLAGKGDRLLFERELNDYGLSGDTLEKLKREFDID